MGRLFSCFAMLGLLLGCASTGPSAKTPEWQSRLDELANAQARLELRIEEVTRNLLALRARLDTGAKAFRPTDENRVERGDQALKVVKLEPSLKQGAKPSPQEPAKASEGEAADLYRKAFNGYREGRFGEAILDFEDFLRRYPDHEYADNAQYWIGESYYSEAEYHQAILEFGRVLERYPREAKAPDAELKIGLCYQKTGDENRAKASWSRVVAQYPESDAAREAQQLLSSK